MKGKKYYAFEVTIPDRVNPHVSSGFVLSRSRIAAKVVIIKALKLKKKNLKEYKIQIEKGVYTPDDFIFRF